MIDPHTWHGGASDWVAKTSFSRSFIGSGICAESRAAFMTFSAVALIVLSTLSSSRMNVWPIHRTM